MTDSTVQKNPASKVRLSFVFYCKTLIHFLRLWKTPLIVGKIAIKLGEIVIYAVLSGVANLRFQIEKRRTLVRKFIPTKHHDIIAKMK